MKLQTCVVISFAVVLGCTMTASAGTITLQELVDGASIESGDKLFEEFTYTAGGDMPDAADVNVTDIVVGGNYGIQFQGAFLDAQGGGSSNATITYTVTATNPSMLISDAHLSGNPDVIGIGAGGTISVTEMFAEAPNNTLTIFNDGAGGEQSFDWTFFDTPTGVLHVEKRITAEAEDLSAVVMSFIDQTFSQSPVPEPAALGLLALGLAAVLMRRRIR